MKLAAGSLNALALGIAGAAIIVPGVSSLDNVRVVWIPVAIVLHLLAHLAFFRLKSED